MQHAVDEGTWILDPGAGDDAGFTDPEAPPPNMVEGDAVAGRYVLRRRIGAGGYGEVFAAWDRLAGQEVAVKLLVLQDQQDRERVRAEVTALRRLRLPGVVGFRDDGELAGTVQNWFVVMDLVEGRPFLARGRRYHWPEIAERVCNLLEVLFYVHSAGVVHRDLKPPNILIGSHGRPVLLDFGLASGRAVAGDGSGDVAGTVQFMAPEQVQGLPVDARTDLYSLGAMVYQALSGRLPHQHPSLSRMLVLRGEQPAAPLCSVAPDVPDAVAQVVDDLLAVQPEGRPATAIDALLRLGGAAPGPLAGPLMPGLPTERVARAAELRVLFGGPDHFFHLVHDSAEVLFMRTGGDPVRVQRELAAWLRAGLAHIEDGRLLLDRVAIRRLKTALRLGFEDPLPPTASADAVALLDGCRRAWPDARPDILRSVMGWSEQRLASAWAELVELGAGWTGAHTRMMVRPVQPAEGGTDAHRQLAEACPPGSTLRIQHLQASGADVQRVLRETVEAVEQLRTAGLLGEVLAVVEPALALARNSSSPDLERRLLGQFIKVLLARESREAIDLALYELGRTTERDEEVERLERLVRVWRAVVDRDEIRAEGLLAGLEPFVDEDLEIWRGSAVQAVGRARGRDAWADSLALLESWAHAAGDERLAKWQGWLGNLRYQQGRFAEAAQLHLGAARRKRCQDAQLASMLNAAWSMLDGQDFAQAIKTARAGRAQARRIDHPIFEAMCTAALRSAGYRLGVIRRPRPDVVAAARTLSPELWGQLALFEAAIAWRAGQLDLARELASTSAEGFERAAFEAQATLASCLAYSLGLGAEATAARLVSLALLGRAPALDVQGLALVGRRSPQLVAPHRDRLLALARTRPPEEWAARREVLSLDEAVRNP